MCSLWINQKYFSISFKIVGIKVAKSFWKLWKNRNSSFYDMAALFYTFMIYICILFLWVIIRWKFLTLMFSTLVHSDIMDINCWNKFYFLHTACLVVSIFAKTNLIFFKIIFVENSFRLLLRRFFIVTHLYIIITTTMLYLSTRVFAVQNFSWNYWSSNL